MATFRYILRDTVRLLTRHFAVVFLTLLTIIAVFLAVGMSILLSVNVTSLASQIESDLTIEAYLKVQAGTESVMRRLAEIHEVKNARYVSPEEALKRLEEKLGQGDQIISLLGNNPLPPSVIITVDKAENLKDVAREVEAFPEVEDVIYAGEVAERLASLAYFLNRFAMAVFVIALVTSLVVMMNTIRIALYSRREEIGVMLLVGATPTYVSLPFLLQGVILGGTGALVALLFLIRAYRWLLEVLSKALPFFNMLDSPKITLWLFCLLVGGGVALGWLCSWTAVYQHIRRALKPR